MSFTSKSAATEHARLPVQCATILCPFPEKFDEDLTKELDKRQQGKTQEEGWFSIYELLFPDAVRPAHPCKSSAKSSDSGVLTEIDLEDPGELLVSQLSSRGASHNLSQMVITRLVTQLESSSDYAGLLNHESQARMMQAIEESLPTFVQQMFESTAASASSSSTSLHDSGTNPASFSDQGTRGLDICVHPPSFQTAHRVDTLQAVDHPWAPLPPINGYGLHEQPTASSTLPLSPSHRTSPAVASNLPSPPDATQPNVRKHYEDFHAASFEELRNVSEQTSGGDRCFDTNGVAAYTPMLHVLDRRSSVTSTIPVAGASISRMVPPQVPQFVQANGLKPRKSMDSGYASMHTMPLDESGTVEHNTYNGVPSGFKDVLPQNSHPGSIRERAHSRAASFNKDYDKIGIMDETSQPFEEGSLQADQSYHSSDPSLRPVSTVQHDLLVPGNYPQVDDTNPDPYGSISDLCLPLFPNPGQEAPIEGLNIYDGESWGPLNPWS